MTEMEFYYFDCEKCRFYIICMDELKKNNKKNTKQNLEKFCLRLFKES